jgi:leucine dehydrogenase
MCVFDSPSYDNHELVHFEKDSHTGLQTIIAVHSTALGPACGGCRLWNYPSSHDALEDVLRLSRGMSYKNALADIPLGGGKAVILAEPSAKTPDLMRAFGRIVESLEGRYITAEDVGVTVEDMQFVAEKTRYVHGLPHQNTAGGDPSPYTAQGVFLGMKAALQFRFDMDEFKDIKVLVQGVGNVGYNLCKLLHAAGAEIYISDIDERKVQRVKAEMPVTVVPADKLLDRQVDIYAPCAMGAVLNEETIPRLKVQIVAGGANNQLANPMHGELLREKGILYAPDYVVNAGGIINVWGEIMKLPVETVCSQVSKIYKTTLKIFTDAEARGLGSYRIADEMAEEIIRSKAA